MNDIPARLTDRAVLAVSGPEAGDFLQDLITNDLAKLAPDAPLYAALLSPQGKILFDFLLFAGNGAILLDCHQSAREGLSKRLSLYKLRARIAIAPRDDLAVVAAGPPDPRLAALGGRAVVPAADQPDGTAAYHRRRFDLGVPEAGDFGSETVFAMDGGLDELHALSFSKGCYVGQELTARMKHRGSDRKRVLPVTAHAPLVAGAEVAAGTTAIGTLMSAEGSRGFALIRLDRLTDAASPLTVGGAPVSVITPAWLFA